VYAGAIVLAPDGRILCQLRDDKPGIIYPGHWSTTPGGHVEPNEHPRDAIVRELFEEFEARVTNLQEFITVVEVDLETRGIYHVFSADLATPVSEIRCHEGQRADFFEPLEAMRLRQHPVSKKILLQFLRKKKGFR